MLIDLHIKNIAVIDEVNISFKPGFNALTGETGAGKSILIDSINMALGERTSRDLIRTGESKASVEACFEVNNLKLRNYLVKSGIEVADDNLVIICREMTAEGKSSCRINGRIMPLAVLKDTAKFLINIHGQNDNQSLLTPKVHSNFVDEYGKLRPVVAKYKKIYGEYNTIKQQIEEISTNEQEKERRLDLLSFQIEEISQANLKVGEEEMLQERREYLSNIEKIAVCVNRGYDAIYGVDAGNGAVYDILSSVVRSFSEVSEYDEQLKDFYERLSSVAAEVEDITHSIRRYVDCMEFEEGALDVVEERLDIIYRIKRKYGTTVAEVLDYYGKISEEIDKIQRSDELLKELQLKCESIKGELEAAGNELSASRAKVSLDLEKKITKELADLDMKRVKFKVMIEPIMNEAGEFEYGPNGRDKIEFLISPNEGEALKPLSKIASGGEMSRVMLAIKSILSDTDVVETLIFDEIDTGVSGRAAQKIAEKICKISKNKQILCITHLAQIASMADEHYLIEKKVVKQKTATQVSRLSYDARKAELARIIGGVKVTDLTIQNAEEMLKNAKETIAAIK